MKLSSHDVTLRKKFKKYKINNSLASEVAEGLSTFYSLAARPACIALKEFLSKSGSV